MTQQTSMNLSPYIKVKGFIQASAFQGVSRNIFIAGHTLATDTLKYSDNTDVPKYTPINAGVLTSVNSAVTFCKAIGLGVKFQSSSTLDMTITSELAAMIILAAQQYEKYAPSLERYTLQNCNFIIGVLGLATQNTKTVKPWEDPTSGSNLFTNISQAQTPIDLFVSPYEYAKGDKDVTTGYFPEMKAMFESRGNSGRPVLGQNWVISSTVTKVSGTIVDDLDNTAYQNSTNMYYPHSNPTQYPAGVIGAMMSVHMVGMDIPFYGRHGEVMPNMPLPTVAQLLSDDDAESVLRNGWTPLRANLHTDVVYQTRIISALLEDPVTEIARDFMLDYQDFKIFWLSLVRVYNRLSTSGILNDRFTVNSKGTSPVLDAVRSLAIAVDIQLYNEGMVAVDPKLYASEYTAQLDSLNINHIIASKPLYPSSIIYQIDESVLTKNFIPLLQSFNILTN
jgi:hypothetical protein